MGCMLLNVRMVFIGSPRRQKENFDTRLYKVDFSGGEVSELMVNIIVAESM